MNHLGIDVETKDKFKIIARLSKLKTTRAVTDGGMYNEDHKYSQIQIDTDWTEAELEDWLYRTKGIEYVGTFVRDACKTENSLSHN